MSAPMTRPFARACRSMASVCLLGAATLAAPTAEAAPCGATSFAAGFTDVADDSPFCPSVEWLRNRQVTTGCGGQQYCPDVPVSRLAMAAFMKRLGEAIGGYHARIDETPGAVDLDAGVVMCRSVDGVWFAYPRTAHLDATISATAAADVSFATELVVSADGGQTWAPVHPQPSRGSVAAGQWSSVSDLGSMAIEAGERARFAIRVSRGGLSGSAHLADLRCRLRLVVHSRTGLASPY